MMASGKNIALSMMCCWLAAGGIFMRLCLFVIIKKCETIIKSDMIGKQLPARNDLLDGSERTFRLTIISRMKLLEWIDFGFHVDG